MKLIDQFDTFLEDTVNLNQTRINTLESRVETIENFLETSDYDATIQRFSPQGSWAHKTIIKPLQGREFDADLVMFVESYDGWSAKDYVNNLYQIFRDSDRYKDKISRGTRCVVINYAGDFHLDVVPCIVREEFAKSEVKAISCFSESSLLIQETGCKDIVKAVLVMGAGFLNRFIPFSLPYVKRLPWRMRSHPISVVINAREYPTRSIYGQSYRMLSSGDVVDKNREIRFEAQFNNGFPASSNDFFVKWQVVNTDKEAAQVNQLRGKFYSSDEPAIRWESTQYRGAHWVEAFVISKRTNECWGRSGRFFIVVK